MCVGSGSAHIFSVKVGCWFSQKKEKKKSVDEFYRPQSVSFLSQRSQDRQPILGWIICWLYSLRPSKSSGTFAYSFHFASSRFVLFFFAFVLLEYWWKSARRVLRQLANSKQNKILYGLDFGMYSRETLWHSRDIIQSLRQKEKVNFLLWPRLWLMPNTSRKVYISTLLLNWRFHSYVTFYNAHCELLHTHITRREKTLYV